MRRFSLARRQLRPAEDCLPGVRDAQPGHATTATVIDLANNKTTSLPQGSFSAAPINMGSATDSVYLTIYATGVQNAGLANVAVTVNGVSTPVVYAGSAGYAGVDQVNVLLPASLAGAGTVALQLTASGIAANTVQVAIQ